MTRSVSIIGGGDKFTLLAQMGYQCQFSTERRPGFPLQVTPANAPEETCWVKAQIDSIKPLSEEESKITGFIERERSMPKWLQELFPAAHPKMFHFRGLYNTRLRKGQFGEELN
ncbi:MAG: hypothetical protein ACREF5_01855 [Candidatus Saccharimonadales bacterium]